MAIDTELKQAQDQLKEILFDKEGKPANPQNIVVITNPDLECDMEDSMEGWSHREFFEVKWDGRPHRLVPGQERRMPLWLATHFAKHLADHILMKEEEESGGKLKGLVNSPVKRPKVLATILLRTEEYFDEPERLSEGEMVERQVEQINTPAQNDPFISGVGGKKATEMKEINIGEVPNKAIGVLKKQKEEPIVPPKTETETSAFDPSKPKPTRAELLSEIEKLDMMDKVPKNATVDQLIGIIASF